MQTPPSPRAAHTQLRRWLLRLSSAPRVALQLHTRALLARQCGHGRLCGPATDGGGVREAAEGQIGAVRLAGFGADMLVVEVQFE